MNILLWAPMFFGYEQQIKDHLISTGHEVHLIHDRPFKSSFLRAITAKFPNVMSYLLIPHYKKKLRAINKNFDYILVIKGQTLSPAIMDYILSKHTNAIKILYLWDSIKNSKNATKNLNKFDNVFSFDITDCQNFKFSYRPLFYSLNFDRTYHLKENHDTRNFVVGFLGTIHSDRLNIINRFLSHNPSLFFKKFMYLHKPWVFIIKYLIDKSFRPYKKSNFEYTSLTLNEAAIFLSKCDAVLDIEHINQTGLTMRTIECIGLNKRLITTNKSVLSHDFYNRKTVYVIDRDHPVVPENFLNAKEFSGYPQEIRFKYSLEGWIKDVFNFS